MRWFTVMSFVLLTCVLPAVGEDSADRPSIAVTGSATIKVAPDFIEWSITLEATEMDPAQAKQHVDQYVAALVEARDDLDVAKDDFETGPASVQKIYEWNQSSRGKNEQVFKGYQITRQVVVRQRDLEEFDAFLTAFAKEGYTLTMQLRSSRADALRREARIEAVKAAQTKAQELAQALGVRAGMPLSVDAMDDSPQPRPMMQNRLMEADGAGDGAGNPFTPGMLEIHVQVQATFELLP